MAQVTLITKEQIASRVAEMGRQITADYAGTNPIALCVLKGAVFFCSDLMRHIDLDISLDFIQVSSYGNEKYSSGVVTVLKEPQRQHRRLRRLAAAVVVDRRFADEQPSAIRNIEDSVERSFARSRRDRKIYMIIDTVL